MQNSGLGGFIEKKRGFRKSVGAHRRMWGFCVATGGAWAYIGGVLNWVFPID